MINESDELILALKGAKKSLIKSGFIPKKKEIENLEELNYPFSIPSNWNWELLSNVSIIQEGPGIRKHQYKDEGIQFLTVTNILEGKVDLQKSKKYISHEEYNSKYKHFTIDKGDIVSSCSGATWGKTAFFTSDEKLILNTSTLRLRFFNDLGDNSYLYYLTKSSFFKNQLRSHQTGQQPNYGYFHYSQIAIPIPSLLEQQAIVEKLDFAFDAIEKAKANIEKNIENAKELFQSKLNEIFSQKGEGWDEKKIEEVCDVCSGFAFKSVDFEKNGAYQVIRMGNVRPGIIRYDENAVFVSKVDEKILNKYLLKVGDIIITQTGSKGKRDYGFSVLIENENLLLNQRISYLRTKSKIKKFILYYTWSENFRNQFFEKENGTVGQGNVSINAIKSAIILVPNLKEQERIVLQLDQLSLQTNLLQEKYKQKLANLEELKKSILEKAFKGELV